LVNLDNYSIENNYYDFCRLLNFKIDNNPSKIYLTENFSKFIYLYEGNNQVSVIDFSLNKKEMEQNNNNIINLNINLKRDINSVEIFPEIYNYSSCYGNDYKPEKLLNDDDDDYYCTRNNRNEFISFKFLEEYYFNMIYITFTRSYRKSKLKKFKISFYDINRSFLRSYDYTNDEEDSVKKIYEINDKGAYLRFYFLQNFGEDYFCIKRIQFFADITHSIK
jgi:hypothetical protein